MKASLKDREHLLRVVGLFVAGVFVFLVLRGLLVPKDFGKYGHYRAGAVDDVRATTPVFAGRQACADCHTDVPDVLKKGKHAGVACEACHGPLARHAEDPEKQKPMKLDPRRLCLTCHTTNVAKPLKFPQIDPAEHGEGDPCTSCHTTPHQPALEGAS
jgi:hypothetical protein